MNIKSFNTYINQHPDIEDIGNYLNPGIIIKGNDILYHTKNYYNYPKFSINCVITRQALLSSPVDVIENQIQYAKRAFEKQLRKETPLFITTYGHGMYITQSPNSDEYYINFMTIDIPEDDNKIIKLGEIY